MNKRIVLIVSFLGALATGSAASSALAAEPLTIGDFGDDGDARYYEVTCSDNTQGSVIEKTQPQREVCAAARDKDEQCRPNWTVKQAAAHVCK